MKRLIWISLLLLLAGKIEAQNNFNITKISELAIGDNGYANIWGYAQGGKEYALLGCQGSATLNDAMAIIDITNAAQPNLLFTVPGPQNLWREIRTHDHYAYVTAESADNTFGVTIVDLQYLPDSIKTKQYTANGLFGNVHALHIEDGFMYLYGSNNPQSAAGALIINLSDPWNPTVAGAYDEKYVHDGIVRGNRMYSGEIFDGTFSIVDISSKQNPVVINTQITPNAFTHNTWLSSNNQILYTTDERPASFVTAYDISNEGNIVELDRYRRANTNEAIPHNTYVLNNPTITGNNSDYVHTSYYTEGTTIVDATKPDNLVEVGHYDTSPGVGSGFSGAWGVYPFLPSGKIIVSDMQLGLFVLQVNYVRACYAEGLVTDAVTSAPIPSVLVSHIGTQVTERTNLSGIYKTGIASPGNLSLRFAAPGYVTQDVAVSVSAGQTSVLNVALQPSVVGINNANASGVKVFPTQFDQELFVELPEANAKVTLQNLQGQILFEQYSTEKNFNINTSHLAAGAYVVSVAMPNHSDIITHKIYKTTN